MKKILFLVQLKFTLEVPNFNLGIICILDRKFGFKF